MLDALLAAARPALAPAFTLLGSPVTWLEIVAFVLSIAMVLANLASHYSPVTSLTFVPVPSDAPELADALAWYQHEMAGRFGHELHNSWGAIIISEVQNNLKRLEVVVVWDQVQTENGFPILGPDGEPVLARDENGNPIRSVNSHTMYINRDAQYFPAPGA
mgnify:CR=1 FL=1